MNESKHAVVPFSTFYHIKSNGDPAQRALTDVYKSTAALDKRKVVWLEKPCHYRVYVNQQQLHRAITSMELDERRFHEVIFEGPQKLKFDIDAPTDRLLASKISGEDALAKFKFLRFMVIDAIRTAYFHAFTVTLPEDDIIVCESVDDAGLKYSSHIIVAGRYVTSSIQAKSFTDRVATYLMRHYLEFVDLGVNNTLQNFRLPLCHKGDGRVKRIVSNHTWEQALIGNTEGCLKLEDLVQAEPLAPVREMYPADLNAVLELCQSKGYLDNFKYRDCVGNLLNFDRLKPSHCELCLESHHTDNTQMIVCEPSGMSIKVYLKCRHFKVGTLREIGEVVADNPSAIVSPEKRATYMENVIRSEIARAQDHVNDTMFDKLPDNRKHIYSADKLKPFEHNADLIIHANMKMGKTKALKEFLKKHYDDTLTRPVIRFVSFRQTFSNAIKMQFPDFELYSDVRGDLNYARLIIQVESLHRLMILEGGAPPDLLILDECESIFEQFNAGLQRNTTCFAKFQYLLRYSKAIVCMDANITDRTYSILSQLRPSFLDNVIYHRNTFKNAVADTYYFTGSKTQWTNIVYKAITDGMKIAIPMSSYTEAKLLERNIKSKFPRASMKVYSSDTSIIEKKEHFRDVNLYWKDCDILIYTPTVSAGLSFEAIHFDMVFGFFTDVSCSVETCVQMLGRVRNLSLKRYVINLSSSGSYHPTTIEDIRTELHTSRGDLFRGFGDLGNTCEYNQDGKMIVHESNYFKVWLENVRMANLSKCFFVRRFVRAAGSAGAQIHFLNDEFYTQLSGQSAMSEEGMKTLEDVKLSRATTKREMVDQNARVVSGSRDVGMEEFSEIMGRIASKEGVSQEDSAAVAKYQLRKTYDIPEDTALSEDFVKLYGTRKSTQVFKHLNEIVANKGDIALSLQDIQDRERNQYTNVMELSPDTQQLDFSNKYRYDKHRYSISLMRACGWDNMMSVKPIHLATIGLNIQSYCKREKLDRYDLLISALKCFSIRLPGMGKLRGYNEIEFSNVFISHTSAIMSKMYGHSITRCGHEKQLCSIRNSCGFKYGDAKWAVSLM